MTVGYTHKDVSLIITGALLDPESQPIMFDTGMLHESVRGAVEKYLSQTEAHPLDLLLHPDIAKAAKEAYSKVKNLRVDWGELLSKRFADNKLLEKLEEAVRDIKAGHDPDISKILMVAPKSASGAVRLSDVEEIENFYIETGLPPLDKFVGGIPREGVTAIFGPTGVGKTTFALALTLAFLKKHPNKSALLLQYEHSAQIVKKLIEDRFPGSESLFDRIYVHDNLRRGFQAIASQTVAMSHAGFLSPYGLVVVDDVNGAAEEPSPQAHSAIWAALQEMSRRLKVPVVVLAQPNRASTTVNSSGRQRFPSIHDIAWAGAAEQVSRLVIGIARCDRQTQEAARSAGTTIYPVHPDGRRHHQLFFLKMSYIEAGSKLRPPFCIIMDNDTGDKIPWLGWGIYGNVAFPPEYESEENGGANGGGNGNGNGKKRL